ncbi:MAG: HAD superfamily hydrolase (TIGR01509 family) [Pseudohongiellaceae bacterium]|jgi:HAD superfamily hydrolase (TIGR01509 family)
MTSPRIVLLDLDGTLVDANEAIVDGVLALAAEAGLKVPDRAWAMDRIGQPPDGTWELLGADDPAAMSARFVEQYVPLLPARTRILPGVVAALEALASFGATLAVATSRTTGAAEHTLQALDLAQHFSEVCGRDLVPAPKPAPELLLLALDRLDARPEEALMIGDSDADVLAARAAGVRCWAVLGGVCDEATLRKAGPERILPQGMAEVPATWRSTTWSSVP